MMGWSIGENCILYLCGGGGTWGGAAVLGEGLELEKSTKSMVVKFERRIYV